MNSIIVSVRHVGVSYWRKKSILRREQFWALRDVSFDLYHGETLGIIGRNGVGKSTLLRVLARIIEPDHGEVISYGSGIASLLSLQVGFSDQLSGRDNAILSGMLLGMRRREIEARLPEIIQFSELEEFIDQPVRIYSAGMRARLGFSVAFHADPDIILLDETLGVGDEAFRKKSSAAMRQRIKSDKAIVLVSHAAGIIKSLCDRAIWIENGVSVAAGEVDNVLGQYQASLSSAWPGEMDPAAKTTTGRRLSKTL